MHAHVARSEDGTKVLELLKRADWSDNMKSYIHRPEHNTNSESVKMNVPAGFAEKDDTNDSGVATVVSMVYVTASPTFSGSIAGYTTASNTLINTSATSDAAATTSPSTIAAASPSTSQVQSANILSSTTAVAVAASSSPTYTPSVGTPLAQTKATTTSFAVASATVASDANANNAGVTVSQQSTGMSDGAKAGLAIGIILGLALAAGLVFFCWKRSKKNSEDDEHNEKSNINEKRSSFFGASSGPKRQSADSDKSFGTVHTTATAPRLSLRPVTQFLPAFGERRKSGNLLGAAAAGPAMSEKHSAWERRSPNGENPFADATEKPSNPFEEGDGNRSAQHSQKSSWEASEPATPKSAQFGTAAAVAVGGAQSPRSPNNVHRVQLDFKPSMEDELELKSGQLVRMLHEYDDGWVSH